MKHLNEKGFEVLKKWLIDNHKKGEKIVNTPSMLNAWAEEADWKIIGNEVAVLEIRPWDNFWGRADAQSFGHDMFDGEDPPMDD